MLNLRVHRPELRVHLSDLSPGLWDIDLLGLLFRRNIKRHVQVEIVLLDLSERDNTLEADDLLPRSCSAGDPFDVLSRKDVELAHIGMLPELLRRVDDKHPALVIF